MKDYFEGFRRLMVDTGEVRIHTLVGGTGDEAVLLLHGHPENHLMWREIAPKLAEKYTVVITDLRGYGLSDKPSGDEKHETYSKRVMARDQVKVMEYLKFDSFHVVAHDRGARVAHRLALDWPNKVKKLMLIDILPTYDMYQGTNKEFATAYWHWFFYLLPDGFPEHVLGGPNAEYFMRWAFDCPPEGSQERAAFDREYPRDVFEEYIKCYTDPAGLHAICEDYRASATIDLEHDEADRDVKIQSPLMVLWAQNGICGRLWNVLDVWKDRAQQVSGQPMPCSHNIPEDMPGETLKLIEEFLP